MTRLEEIDELLGLAEVFLLLRRPMPLRLWRRYAEDGSRQPNIPANSISFSWVIDELLRLGKFEVTRRVRVREEEWMNGSDDR